jgi:predicted anti-sigma-YlaC factor YlaD
MSEPYFYPDHNKLSNCCGAVSLTEIVDDLGMCSKCREWADFAAEEEPESALSGQLANPSAPSPCTTATSEGS